MSHGREYMNNSGDFEEKMKSGFPYFPEEDRLLDCFRAWSDKPKPCSLRTKSKDNAPQTAKQNAAPLRAVKRKSQLPSTW